MVTAMIVAMKSSTEGLGRKAERRWRRESLWVGVVLIFYM